MAQFEADLASERTKEAHQAARAVTEIDSAHMCARREQWTCAPSTQGLRIARLRAFFFASLWSPGPPGPGVGRIGRWARPSSGRRRGRPV